MLEQYYALFQIIAQGAANLAEQSMEEAQKTKSLESYKSAKEMRDDYITLYYKLKDNKTINITDARRLYIAATLMVAKLQADVTKTQQTITDYKNELLPRLKAVISDEENFLENLQKSFS